MTGKWNRLATFASRVDSGRLANVKTAAFKAAFPRDKRKAFARRSCLSKASVSDAVANRAQQEGRKVRMIRRLAIGLTCTSRRLGAAD
jgi:hypothetical protein